MRKVFCALLIFVCATFIYAQKKPTFRSVYTDMKRYCKTLNDPEGESRGSDPPGVCKGYGGYRISIGYSAWAAHLAIKNMKNPDESILLGTDYGGYGAKGEKVEWRMANGKPFAVIMRFGIYEMRDGSDDPFAKRTGSRLVVKGLKNFEQIDFEIDGATTNANQKAREMADSNYSKK